MSRVRTVLLVVLSLGYPLLMYFALGRFEPRWLALLLFVLAGLRALATRDPVWLAAAGGSGVLAVAATVFNAAMPLRLYPALVNAVMLVVFALSLRYPPTVIERFARRSDPNLPPSGVRYTRRVTQVWCGFFIFNGSLALITALWASAKIWALYNGLIAYVLMGVLFGGEWLLRQRFKAAHGHG